MARSRLHHRRVADFILNSTKDPQCIRKLGRIKGSILVLPVGLGDVTFPVVKVRKKSDVSQPNRGYQNTPVNLSQVEPPLVSLVRRGHVVSSSSYGRGPCKDTIMKDEKVPLI
ncbi:hypothetical protein AVEN_25460-1 [Araneus ventricosus]|uniref:Uncharacterized protein n=1 Tax=Araneus ventricosus TaxID=182803 RepID=A0A4Y2N5I7_ARAVE|nr:hypothetical protein AVEN_25460-1 [Araneus ventricosus]